jgi:hypothetical protein
VVVHNQPHAIDPPKARGPTHPPIFGGTAHQCATHVIETVNEGQLAIRCDVQITYVVANGAREGSEQFSPGATFIVRSFVSQRQTDVE